MTAPMLEIEDLHVSYGQVDAVRGVTLTLQPGQIVSVIGPNGAGKTTLLAAAMGLLPSKGKLRFEGEDLHSLDVEARVERGLCLVPEKRELFGELSVLDNLMLGAFPRRLRGAGLKRRLEFVYERFPRLGERRAQRADTLSGGQRAQVALALTLAKRPRVLLLDEPLAALDPLARQNFLAALAEVAAVQGDGLTIVLSSHLIADIERVCDHLILLADSRVQLCGDIDTLLTEHRVLVGPRKDTTAIARAHTIVREDSTARQTTLLVRLNGPVLDPAWAVEETNLEEMVLGYMTQGGAGPGTGPAAGRLSAVGGDR